MIIDLAAPASMVLGLIRSDDSPDSPVSLLGVALQHPPIHLAAEAYSGLLVSGPRADLARAQLDRLHAGLKPERGVQIEIELSIPTLMGLGSDVMLGLSVARALAWANERPLDDVAAWTGPLGLEARHGLHAHAFAQGGLLLVDAAGGSAGLPAVRGRREIAHEDKQAWAFVLVLPRPDDDAPESLEEDWLRDLVAAGRRLGGDTGRILTSEIWPAVESDDLARFGRALMDLQRLNDQALEQAGKLTPIPADMQAALEVMRENGAVAWGRIPAGLGYFGLVRGAAQTRALRTKLQHHLGYYGGLVMATITDNGGARHVVKDEPLAKAEFTVRQRPAA